MFMQFSTTSMRIAVIAAAGCALADVAHGDGGLDCAVGGVQIDLPSTNQPATPPKPGLAQVLIHCKPAPASLNKTAPKGHHIHPRTTSGAQVIWNSDHKDASSVRSKVYSTQTSSLAPGGSSGP